MKNEQFCPKNFKDCFYMDEHILNPIPKGIFKKIYYLYSYSRYSMPTMMRLSQYFFNIRAKSKSKFKKYFFALLSSYFTRKNQIANSFEVSPMCKIQPGVVFHYSGVCITSDTVIESGVQVCRNVTFGIRGGSIC